MEILLAKEMGFCFGVRRAVDMMEEATEETSHMVSLGSVVHNPQVVAQLKERGLDVIASLEDVSSQPVAITAHGVSQAVVQELEDKGVSVLDTTCPIVTRSQQWAKRLTEEGFAVIVFGDPDHKETRGVLGWADGNAYAIPSIDDIPSLPSDMPTRIGVLSQTTETESHFADFVRALLEQRMDVISELRVINTLCNATTSQQAAARELAHQVDMMIVIGGRESANTHHLAEVTREEGTIAHQVESADDIQAAWLEGHERIGVTAGASTPDSAIDAVVARLRELSDNGAS
ncbi:MAG: 4-hydroxy-3-methylbut-2-enyl diphosphate reductase [Chloroflexi bacterium]|nr:4-hydroxy-3-methylbut-2-enyl diphosphate reductase [Chloroflexota bacterium]MCH8009729.1 4-hydroxy-3-methylbut-2-enyl diphosphate reductase [Chloroflexota bacterium]MCH8161208.1 4-hydroxy-3-methylbut-2-enyl diphosphate reductase [Chloroflexota bacterium]